MLKQTNANPTAILLTPASQPRPRAGLMLGP
nr:MAG TPA: hypothetical protein [Caudoviricetes sp.]